MLTIPGWAFKILSPVMILWGLVSLVLMLNRRGRTRALDDADDAELEQPAKRKAEKPSGATTGASGAKRGARSDVAKRKRDARPEKSASTKASETSESDVETTSNDSELAQAKKPQTRPVRAADSLWNPVISVGIGIGMFLFSAPVSIPQGSLPFRIFAGLGVFARGVVQRSTWVSPWQSLPIYSYGVMLGTSLVVGWFVTLTLAARQGMPKDRMADCYVFTAFSAVVGSRVLYVLTNLHEFQDPQTHQLSFSMMLQMRSGGLVAYGGFLGGLFGSIFFLRRHRLSLWKWADAAVPSLATGLMITRLGCYMYGCDFGKPLSAGAPGFLRRLGTFPHWADDHGAPAWQQHVVLGFRSTETDCTERLHGTWRYHSDTHQYLCHLDQAARSSVPVHPTQLYESLTGLTLFVILMWLWRRRKFDGQIFLAFGFLYGFARSALEIIRDDHERGFYFGLSTSQLIGLSTAVLAIIVYVIRSRTAPPSSGASLFGGGSDTNAVLA